MISASVLTRIAAAASWVNHLWAAGTTYQTSCKIHATLTTVEKLRRGRVIGVAAAQIRSKRFTIASATLVIPAGQTVKVTLKQNATGRRLLRRFHRLPVRLTVTLEGPAGRRTVIAQSLTIKPQRKAHRKRH